MRSLLIVDDDESYLEILKYLIEPTGITAYFATSAVSAMSILEDRQVEILITDFNMPGMNGCQLAAKVKESFPDVAIIMATGELTTDVRIAAQHAGIVTVLEKPFEVFQMLDILCAQHADK